MKDSPGVPVESHVDRLIREATERGEFDHLEGEGKPIRGAGTTDDEYWWLREWVKRNVSQDRDVDSKPE